MPTPDPTYSDGLVLVDQPLQLNTLSRMAHATYACADTASQDPQDIANAVQNAWQSTIDAALSDQVTVPAPTVKVGDGTTTPAVAVGDGGAGFGETDLGTLPSPNVCIVLKKITALAGRANRGRMYLPWAFGEAGISDTGLLGGGQLAAVQGAATAFLTALAAADLPMVICNRTITANPSPPPATYISHYGTGATVTQFTLEPYAATQRRRMPRS